MYVYVLIMIIGKLIMIYDNNVVYPIYANDND